MATTVDRPDENARQDPDLKGDLTREADSDADSAPDGAPDRAPDPEGSGRGGARSWWRRALPVVVVLLTFGVLGAGGYVAYELLIDSAAQPDEEEVARAAAAVEDAVAPDVIDQVRETVSETHTALNRELGYGEIERLDIAEFDDQHGRQIRDELGEVIDAVDHDALVRDLESARELLRIGVEGRDRDALVWAHRIMHDLDYFAFNPDQEGTYWQATLTLEGDDNGAMSYLAEVRG